MDEFLPLFPVLRITASAMELLAKLPDAAVAAGWRPVRSGGDRPVALLVVTAADQVPAADARGAPLLLASAGGSTCAEFDDRLTPAMDRVALTARLAAWRPPALVTLERLATAFGADAIGPLLTGLAREVAAALADLHAGGTPDLHRLAGLAGTLGFGALTAAANGLAQGEIETADLRRALRIVQTTLCREGRPFGFTPAPPLAPSPAPGCPSAGRSAPRTRPL